MSLLEQRLGYFERTFQSAPIVSNYFLDNGIKLAETVILFGKNQLPNFTNVGNLNIYSFIVFVG